MINDDALTRLQRLGRSLDALLLYFQLWLVLIYVHIAVRNEMLASEG